jgi:FAD/FMN-containing dehydrogenase
MNENTQQLIAQLRSIVGDAGLVTAAEEQASYVKDWLNKWHGRVAVVVRPADTAQTAEVVRLCHRTHTPIVTQGGNTGMSGGATPDDSGAQVILSTTRMNRIRAVDPINNTMTVDAGVILAHAQDAARAAGRYFPLSLGAEGSCTIGGNLATNAGGIAVLRFGNMRELALGLEVVLPDGRIWNGLRGLRKDNTGYDLRDLFIGSEGSLGVITGAVLKLFSQPHARYRLGRLRQPGAAGRVARAHAGTLRRPAGGVRDDVGRLLGAGAAARHRYPRTTGPAGALQRPHRTGRYRRPGLAGHAGRTARASDGRCPGQ